jgi:hypothetical protein
MIDAEDEYIEFFRFQATEGSTTKTVAKFKPAVAMEIEDHTQILGVELQEQICLYLYQRAEEFVWIGTVEDSKFNIMDPACAFSDNQPKYSFEVLESSVEFIILVANEASTDVGVIAFTKKDKEWKSWSLNEGAGVVLPIKDGEDTFPKSIWLSFDSKESIPGFSQDSPKIPPSPVLNIKLNTGDLLGYHCIRTDLKEDDLYYSKMNKSASMQKLENETEKITRYFNPSVINGIFF